MSKQNSELAITGDGSQQVQIGITTLSPEKSKMATSTNKSYPDSKVDVRSCK